MFALLALLPLFNFKKFFPLVISLLFVFNYFGIPFGGIGNSRFAYFFSIELFFVSIYYSKSKKGFFDINLRVSFYIILFYVIYLFVVFLSTNKSYKDFLRLSLPLTLQFYIFSTLVYLKKYGVLKLMNIIYITMIIYLIVWSAYLFIPFRQYGVIGLRAYHAATVGFAAAYIIGYNLFIIKKTGFLNIILISISSLLPILGMSRGGIISILITFLVFLSYKRLSFKTLFLTVGFVLLFILGNYFIIDVIPKELLYFHLGSHNLQELFFRTEDINESIGLRIIRWNFLIELFTSNPLFGVGIYHSTISTGLSNELFENLWVGHNFYLSMLSITGLIISFPIIFLHLKGLFESINILHRKPTTTQYFGILILLNVININFTNTYFALFWSGPFIWVLFALSLILINNSNG